MLCLCGLPARAGVIFDDFGAGHSYDGGSGWSISAADSLAHVANSRANLFTTIAGGMVTQIDVALARFSGTGGVTVGLWTNGGGVPGMELGSWSVTTTTTFGTCCTVVTIDGLHGPVLQAGQSYFMLIIAGSGTWDVWNQNNQGAFGLAENSSDGGATWSSVGSPLLGAFDILGDTAPEPAPVLLIGAGMVWVLMRGRRQAVR
jgi:hypothetical protein